MKKAPCRKAQSIFEYICVTIVFAGIGISGFILANQAAAARLRGEIPTYKSIDTEMGKTLNDGVSKEQYNWEGAWDKPEPAFGGVVPSTLVDNPNAQPLPVPKEE